MSQFTFQIFFFKFENSLQERKKMGLLKFKKKKKSQESYQFFFFEINCCSNQIVCLKTLKLLKI